MTTPSPLAFARVLATLAREDVDSDRDQLREAEHNLADFQEMLEGMVEFQPVATLHGVTPILYYQLQERIAMVQRARARLHERLYGIMLVAHDDAVQRARELLPSDEVRISDNYERLP